MAAVPDAAELDAMEENELLFSLGRETVGDAAVPQSLGSLVQRGRELVRKIAPQAKDLLCDADGPRALLKEITGQSLHEAVALAIAGVATGLTPLACAYVAALILRRGLDLYCAAPASVADAQASTSASTAP